MSYLTPKREALLKRFVKVAAAGAAAWALQWVTAGGLIDWVSPNYAPMVQGVITAVLLGAEKSLRTPATK